MGMVAGRRRMRVALMSSDCGRSCHPGFRAGNYPLISSLADITISYRLLMVSRENAPPFGGVFPATRKALTFL